MGDLCEMTEVGCVLVGRRRAARASGRRSSASSARSRAGSSASPGSPRRWWTTRRRPRRCCPLIGEQLRRRVLVAHNASFDRRVLKQAFERAGVEWPDPPVLCTVAMGRRFAPLARQRKLALLAESLGIEVDETHRALPDALTCARIFCALFPKLCANAASLADALRLLGPRRRPAKNPPPKIPREQRPDLSKLPDDPGVYVFRNEAGQPLYVGKSVAVKSRARAHFCQPGEWTGQAEVVDYIPTNSELGALVLENRLIKQWKPTGQPRAQAHRPLGLPRLPPRHPLPRARGGARAGVGPGGEHRAGQGPARRARTSPTRSPRSSSCATAAASSCCASTRRSTGRWAAASPPASATSTRTPTGAGSTRRSGCSTVRRPGAAAGADGLGDGAGGTGAAIRARRRHARPARAHRGAARRVWAAWSAPFTQGRARCWPSIRSSGLGRSGSRAVASSTGARCQRAAAEPGRRPRAAGGGQERARRCSRRGARDADRVVMARPVTKL